MKRIFLCGSSILLSGLAGSLGAVPDVEVIQRPALSSSIDLMDLDLVVVDFDEVAPADVLAVLRARPDLKVVGVNTSGSAVTVLSSEVYLVHSMAEVMEFL